MPVTMPKLSKHADEEHSATHSSHAYAAASSPSNLRPPMGEEKQSNGLYSAKMPNRKAKIHH